MCESQGGLYLNKLRYYLYEKLATRWVERMTSRFLTEEAPSEDDNVNRANLFQSRADRYLKTAQALRLDYYQNHGRRARIAWGIYKPSPTPNTRNFPQR